MSAFRTFFAVVGCWGALLVVAPARAQQQSTQELFGKNRLQYKQFAWKSISTTNFEVYFYQNGNEAAYQAARYAETDFDRIADLLGYTPYAKTKIFLYNSVADLQQSNVGLSNEDALTGGQVGFLKSQVEIPFNGNQVLFRRDLNRLIAQVFISEMMFGGSLKDMLQSSLLLALPDWFMSGAAAYVANGWSLEMDDFMRDATLNRNLRKPQTLTGERATLVGQSIWNYIAERYGKANISNILNLTRIIRNEETSIASTLGVPYGRFVKDWRQYYGEQATQVAASYLSPAETFRVRKQNRRDLLYHQVRISPDGRLLAYSENHKGAYRVRVTSLDRRQTTTVLRAGSRLISQRVDQQVPLLDWQNNRTLAIVTADQGHNRLYLYDLSKGTRRKLSRTLDNFSEIMDFDLSDDGTTMVMSADQNGQSDVFTYAMSGGTVKQLTNDLFDDLNPHFLTGSTAAFAFSSNRLSDSLTVSRRDFRDIKDSYGLFVYDPAAPSLQKIVTSLGNATHPVAASERLLFYLDDEKGIQNLYRYDLVDRTTAQVSDFRQAVRSYDLNLTNQVLAYHALSNGRASVGVIKPFDFDKTVNPVFTRRNENQEMKALERPPASTGLGEINPNGPRSPAAESRPARPNAAPATTLAPGEVDTDNYLFDSDVLKAAEEAPAPAATTKPKPNILLGNARTSRRKDNIVIRGPFDYESRFKTNSLVNTVSQPPIVGLGVGAGLVMNDLLDDHVLHLSGTLNIADFRSNNFLLDYRYLRHRVDFGLRIERRQLYLANSGGYGLIVNSAQKYRLNQVMASASYPFSASSRLTAAPFYTNTTFQDLTLPAPGGGFVSEASTHFGGLRLEYVFDNTVVNGMNMMEGTRAKVRLDSYNGIGAASESFYKFTVDVRNYFKLHRELILATRLSFGHFGGPARKRFLVGGMDNWLFRYQENNPSGALPNLRELQSGTDYRDFFFLDFASNLRGFGQNKISGYNHLLFNAELRLPLIKYLYRSPITSNFLKNLQLVAFTDVGTAWNEQSPFSRQNDLNTVVLNPGGPFSARVVNFKNPFLVGYGLGVRTFLLGYYVKFDAGWGLEDRVVSPARYYLTLGYDF